MLFVFVEGTDDQIFVDRIFGEDLFDYKIIPYSKMQKTKVINYIKSINCIPDSDFLFLSDDDQKGLEAKKQELKEIYTNLPDEKIHIVQLEIESWYYAGVTQEDCKKLKMSHFQYDTNHLSKEQFNSKLLRLSERKYVMSRMLDVFSKELASSRNNSFGVFYQSIVKGSATV